jgi:GTP-binding protein
LAASTDPETIIWREARTRRPYLLRFRPPCRAGLKLNYMTQAKAQPPSFVLFCTRADAVPDDYKRYLVNGLRETFELPGVPIRLMLREKENPFAGKSRNRNRSR